MKSKLRQDIDYVLSRRFKFSISKLQKENLAVYKNNEAVLAVYKETCTTMFSINLTVSVLRKSNRWFRFSKLFQHKTTSMWFKTQSSIFYKTKVRKLISTFFISVFWSGMLDPPNTSAYDMEELRVNSEGFSLSVWLKVISAPRYYSVSWFICHYARWAQEHSWTSKSTALLFSWAPFFTTTDILDI